MSALPLLDRETVVSLLHLDTFNGFVSAESERPWSTQYSPALRHNFQAGMVLDQLHDTVLMRCFGWYSGSKPDNSNDKRMQARAPRLRLDAYEIRKDTLTRHADHKTRTSTPYISFTSCHEKLQDLANWRQPNADQSIVVVDPDTRFELGLPILHFRAEMAHYDITSPYDRDYWTSHYLCLWEVTPAEVVGVWRWDELRKTGDWFASIIMPAVSRHRHRRSLNEPPRAPQRRSSSPHQSVIDSPDEIEDEVDDSDSDDGRRSTYSDDSYDHVCDENFSGEICKLWEDFRID